MKVLIDGEVYSWHRGGGISRVFNEVVPRLAAQGLSLEVGVRRNTPEERIHEAVKPYVSWIPQVDCRLHPWRLMRLLAAVINPVLEFLYWRGRRGDIFLSSYYTTPPVRMPKICVAYDMIFELFPDFFDPKFQQETVRRQRCAINQADKTICISENTRRDVGFLHQVPGNKLRTILMGGGTTSYGQDCGAPVHPRRFLLYVGDFRCGYKNFEFMMKTLGAIQHDGIRKLDLVVASRVPVSGAEIDTFGKWLDSRRINFLHSCDDETLVRLYRQCEAFVYPSLYEGFGLPVTEALCQGAPVVCSDTASLPEVGGDVVYYFNPTSPEQFSRALLLAIAEGRRPDAVARRRKHAAQFSWDLTAKEFVQVFQELQANSGACL